MSITSTWGRGVPALGKHWVVSWGKRTSLAAARTTACFRGPVVSARGFSAAAQPEYSWAPVCAIGAAERDDVEKAARQTLRVLSKKDDMFQTAAVEGEDEQNILAEVAALAGQALDRELHEARKASNGNNNTGAEASAELQARIRHTFTAVERGLIEREAESRLLVLAALCGEHLLLLGPPGTAKSALSRQLSSALRAPYFERQLTRFSVPEELFGPLSLTELQQDRYVRKTDGYLPSCSIAFIDEIFKANSAILNSLLTIINEREFDNGNVREPVPLICLVGASNEPPDDDELDALYDRFLLRRYVRPVSREARPGLLEVQKQHRDTAEDAEGICSFTAMEVKDLKATAMATVTIPADVKQLIEDLLLFLDESGVYVSDRRLVKSAAMLRVAAMTSGRDAVTKYDCLLLQHVFWKHPEEAAKIEEWFVDYFVTPGADVDQVSFLLSGLFKRIWRSSAQSEPIAQNGRQEEWEQDLRKFKGVLCGQLSRWEQEAHSDGQTLGSNIWQTEEDMLRLEQRLRPDLAKRQADVHRILHEIVTLETALQTSGALKPHMMVAAVPRHGQELANGLLQDDSSTSDKRHGLQLLKAIGLGYLLPASLQRAL